MLNVLCLRQSLRQWNRNLLNVTCTGSKVNSPKGVTDGAKTPNLIQPLLNQTRTLASLTGFQRKTSSEDHNTSKSKLPIGLLTALFSGGVLLIYLKQQLREAQCHSTFSVPVDDQHAQSKWKDLKIKLYQYQTCPFCSKVRSFLLANRIPFEIVEVHPITKREIKFSQYKKVPIVVMENGDQRMQVNDSSVIISALSSYILDQGNQKLDTVLCEYSEEKEIDEKLSAGVKYRHTLNLDHGLLTDEDEIHVENEAEWRAWADNHLVHIISPNVYRTLGESYQSFKYHVHYGQYKNGFDKSLALYGGTVAMWLVSKMLKKKHCGDQDVRIVLYQACKQWTDALKDRDYMGGVTPDLSDISVFGVLSVMEGLPIWNEILENTSIKDWYYRTKGYVYEQEYESPTK